MFAGLSIATVGQNALGGQARYFYDELSRLVRVERADGVLVTYTYDALGNRLSKRITHDQDFDNTPDAEDCAPADPTAFAIPREVTDLVFGADKVTLEWSSAGPTAGTGTVHDAPRGNLGGWPVGSGGGEICLTAGTAGSTATDLATPVPGGGFWYLVRGRNACGVGTYGTTSAGGTRTTATCP